MPAEVTIKKGEPADRALKRLKNKLESEGILEEMRRRRAFETPDQRAKRKARANAKRNRNTNNRVRFNLYPPRPQEDKGEAAEKTAAPASE
ncbi:30S ribosomal protein S21 [Verrucomicrobiales bacterium]|nr:30S ribosomal protein S21 [Verrucomicrobiales bacterium]